MNDSDVAAALAAQEEHIKRTLSCGGVVGRAHRYRPHGNPETKAQFSACRLEAHRRSGLLTAVRETAGGSWVGR